MNRIMKIALAAVIAGIALPVFAQDNFPDVPDNHWAFEAVEGLKKAGILVGYPDGLYRGNRPMSRYEFAAATYAAYQKVMGMHKDLSDQIAALQDMVKNMQPGNNADLMKQLQDMKAQVDSMSGWGNRIADLERMSKEFERELASMGVDVKKLRQDLSDLEGRVAELEKHKPAVDIHGTMDWLMLAGHSTDGNFGITPSNRITGAGKGSYTGIPVGLSRDLTMLHEAALSLTGTNTEGPKWEATVVVGNFLSAPFGPNALGNQSMQNAGNPFAAGDEDVYVQTANVTFDTSLVGQGFTAKLGRVGYQVGPYLWKRPDFTTYAKLPRWDSGDYYFDGGILSFGFGKAALKVFGGTDDSVTSVNGNPVNPMFVGVEGYFGTVGPTLPINRTLGVQLDFPVGEMGSVNLAYLWHDSDTRLADVNPDPGLQAANRLNTFGGQLDLKFNALELWASYAKSILSENTSNSLDTQNSAWDIRANWSGNDKWGIGGGYREVEHNFMALGSWGRLGNQWRPTNIKGFNANIWFNPSAQTKLWARGEFDEPKDSAAGLRFSQYDRIDSFKIGLDHQFTDNWGATLSYEDTQFKGAGAVPDDKERWYTVGFNYGMGANANLMFTYQFSDVDFAGGSLLDPNGPSPIGGRKYRGGLFGTQLSVKF